MKKVFETVDGSGFLLHTVIKNPSLVAAIIGQKIAFTTARKLRSQFYRRYGTDFTPEQIYNQDLSFLGQATIIQDVTSYLIAMTTEADIRELECIQGIGPWTIETTLLTCLKNWDLFPL